MPCQLCRSYVSGKRYKSFSNHSKMNFLEDSWTLVESLMQFFKLCDVNPVIAESELTGFYEFVFVRVPDIAQRLWTVFQELDAFKTFTKYWPALIYGIFIEKDLWKLMKVVETQTNAQVYRTVNSVNSSSQTEVSEYNKRKMTSIITYTKTRKDSKIKQRKKKLKGNSKFKLNDKCGFCQCIKTGLDVNKQLVISSSEIKRVKFADQLNACTRKRSKSKIIQASEPRWEMKLVQAVGSFASHKNALMLKTVSSLKQIKTPLGVNRSKLNAWTNNERPELTTRTRMRMKRLSPDGKKENTTLSGASDNFISSWNQIKERLWERIKKRRFDRKKGENFNSQKGCTSKLEHDKDKEIIKEERYKRIGSFCDNKLMKRESGEARVEKIKPRLEMYRNEESIDELPKEKEIKLREHQRRLCSNRADFRPIRVATRHSAKDSPMLMKFNAGPHHSEKNESSTEFPSFSLMSTREAEKFRCPKYEGNNHDADDIIQESSERLLSKKSTDHVLPRCQPLSFNRRRGVTPTPYKFGGTRNQWTTVQREEKSRVDELAQIQYWKEKNQERLKRRTVLAKNLKRTQDEAEPIEKYSQCAFGEIMSPRKAIASATSPVVSSQCGSMASQAWLVSNSCQTGSDVLDKLEDNRPRIMTELNSVSRNTRFFSASPDETVRVTKTKLCQIQSLNILNQGDCPEATGLTKLVTKSNEIRHFELVSVEQRRILTENTSGTAKTFVQNKRPTCFESSRQESTESIKSTNTSRLRAHYIKSRILDSKKKSPVGARRQVSSLPSTPRQSLNAGNTPQSASCPPSPKNR